jgi:hypothetical protein
MTELVKKYYEIALLKRNKFHKSRAYITMERQNAVGALSVGCINLKQ